MYSLVWLFGVIIYPNTPEIPVLLERSSADEAN